MSAGIFGRHALFVLLTHKKKVLETQKVGKLLLSKIYNFSGNELMVKGQWGVEENVRVTSDRLYLQTYKDGKCTLSTAMLEDIMLIEESFHMRIGNIVLGGIGLILGFIGSAMGFILPIVSLMYCERKITIYLRNGNILTIYSRDEELATQFIEDMKKIKKNQNAAEGL